jgi:hypothetical protein
VHKLSLSVFLNDVSYSDSCGMTISLSHLIVPSFIVVSWNPFTSELRLQCDISLNKVHNINKWPLTREKFTNKCVSHKQPTPSWLQWFFLSRFLWLSLLFGGNPWAFHYLVVLCRLVDFTGEPIWCTWAHASGFWNI